jgi:hypothetical protein
MGPSGASFRNQDGENRLLLPVPLLRRDCMGKAGKLQGGCPSFTNTGQKIVAGQRWCEPPGFLDGDKRSAFNGADVFQRIVGQPPGLRCRKREVQRDSGLHFDFVAIYVARAEAPLLYGGGCSLRKERLPADQIHALYQTVFADMKVENYRTLHSLPASFFRIVWLHAIEQVAFSEARRQGENSF